MAQAPPLPFDVKAISGYSARNGNELSLEVGKVYRVLATDGRGVWWQSKSDEGTVGWFPASYTQVIETPPVVEAVPISPPVQQQHQHQPQPQPAQQQHQSQPQPQPQPAQQQHTVSTPVTAAAQPQAQVASVQSQPQHQPTPSNGSHVGSVPSDRGVPLRSNVDGALRPSAPPLKDPCTVTLHVVESVHTTLPNGKPPTFFLYKKAIINQDPKKIKTLILYFCQS